MGNNVTITDCVDGEYVVGDKSVDSLTILCTNVVNLKTLVWGSLIIRNPTNMHYWLDVDKDLPVTEFTIRPTDINPDLNPMLNKFRVQDELYTILEFPKL